MKYKVLPLLLAICGLALNLAPALAQKPSNGPPPALVQVGKVLQKNVETKVTLAGTAEPHRLITVAARVEGMVTQGLVEDGQAVKKGQVLVRLDTSRLGPRLAEAKAMLKETEATLRQFKRDLKRQKILHTKKSVALKSFEDAQTSVERQYAAVDRQRQQIKQLELDLKYSTVRAPLAGVVVLRQAFVGEWVKKGGPVARLSVLDPLKVVVPVPERYLPALATGAKACASADALPGREFCGQIQAIIPSGDYKSRTFPVQLRLPNPGGEIKPGMLVRVTLGVSRQHDALLVPKDALVMSGTSQKVFAVIAGKAVAIPVDLVAAHGNLMEVTGALKDGMTIVTLGNERLFPGQPVNIQKPGGAPSAPPEK
jgi:RND family efflux transporter MFP subunit